MSPFVRDGDLGFFYHLDRAGPGDVVLYLDNMGKLRCGRIIACAGQEISFPESGGYRIDGYEPSEEIPYETYLPEKNPKAAGPSEAAGQSEAAGPSESAGQSEAAGPSESAGQSASDRPLQFPITVPEGQYFILNDFRSITTDSREQGCIDQSRIRGTLLFLLRRRNF